MDTLTTRQNTELCYFHLLNQIATNWGMHFACLFEISFYGDTFNFLFLAMNLHLIFVPVFTKTKTNLKHEKQRNNKHPKPEMSSKMGKEMDKLFYKLTLGRIKWHKTFKIPNEWISTQELITRHISINGHIQNTLPYSIHILLKYTWNVWTDHMLDYKFSTDLKRDNIQNTSSDHNKMKLKIKTKIHKSVEIKWCILFFPLFLGTMCIPNITLPFFLIKKRTPIFNLNTLLLAKKTTFLRTLCSLEWSWDLSSR